MNTPLSNKDVKSIQDKFKSLFTHKSEEEEYRHGEVMLMNAFLSEIETVQKWKGISRKTLAELISISASYLTQVFRSNKPLNFYTLSKIQKKLKIKFVISSIPIPEDNSAYKASKNSPSPITITNEGGFLFMKYGNVRSAKEYKSYEINVPSEQHN